MNIEIGKKKSKREVDYERQIQNNEYLEQVRQDKQVVYEGKLAKVDYFKATDAQAMQIIQKMKYDRELEKDKLKRSIKVKNIISQSPQGY